MDGTQSNEPGKRAKVTPESRYGELRVVTDKGRAVVRGVRAIVGVASVGALGWNAREFVLAGDRIGAVSCCVLIFLLGVLAIAWRGKSNAETTEEWEVHPP